MWKEIWNNNDRIFMHTLEYLIKIDGFDTNTSTSAPLYWLERFNRYIEIIQKYIGDFYSVFEVGCGSGAFLFYLQRKRKISKIGGLDFSVPLINIAKCFVNGDFILDEAINLKEEPKYDLVLSHSVFFYFPNLEYAEKVIEKMIKKANKGIAILDVNDIAKKEIYHKLRKSNKPSNHLFFSKKWFEDIARKFNKRIYIFNLEDEIYLNSKYRFNVLLY